MTNLVYTKKFLIIFKMETQSLPWEAIFPNAKIKTKQKPHRHTQIKGKQFDHGKEH